VRLGLHRRGYRCSTCAPWGRCGAHQDCAWGTLRNSWMRIE
jgi:hypothetical protein